MKHTLYTIGGYTILAFETLDLTGLQKANIYIQNKSFPGGGIQHFDAISDRHSPRVDIMLTFDLVFGPSDLDELEKKYREKAKEKFEIFFRFHPPLGDTPEEKKLQVKAENARVAPITSSTQANRYRIYAFLYTCPFEPFDTLPGEMPNLGLPRYRRSPAYYYYPPNVLQDPFFYTRPAQELINQHNPPPILPLTFTQDILQDESTVFFEQKMIDRANYISTTVWEAILPARLKKRSLSDASGFHELEWNPRLVRYRFQPLTFLRATKWNPNSPDSLITGTYLNILSALIGGQQIMTTGRSTRVVKDSYRPGVYHNWHGYNKMGLYRWRHALACCPRIYGQTFKGLYKVGTYTKRQIQAVMVRLMATSSYFAFYSYAQLHKVICKVLSYLVERVNANNEGQKMGIALYL